MFENRYDIAYKLLMAVFILMALYSMLDPALATVVGKTDVNGTLRYK